MITRPLEVDADGLPPDDGTLNFDYKAAPDVVMAAVDVALAQHGLQVVQLTEDSDEFYFKIEEVPK